MKKIITLAAVLAVASAAFAVDFSLGFRGNFNMGLGTTFDKNTEESIKKSEEQAKKTDTYDFARLLGIGGGFGIYGDLGFANFGGVSLGAQLEFDMNFGNGAGYKYTSKYGSYSYTYETMNYASSIEIPLLVTLDIPLNDTLKLGFGLGPNFSIPFGAGQRWSYDNNGTKDSGDYKADENLGTGVTISYDLNFGMIFDADFGFKVGPGYLLFDVRYLLDFTPTKINYLYNGKKQGKPYEVAYRRSLNLGFGYEFKF